MGKTCEPKAFSFQCMTKFTTNKKKKKKEKIKAKAKEKKKRMQKKKKKNIAEYLQPYQRALQIN